MLVSRGLLGAAALVAVFMIVRASSWEGASNCVSDFRGQVTNNKFSQKYNFESAVKEKTFNINQQGCPVVGVRASTCDTYGVSLTVLSPDAMYFSRDFEATTVLSIDVDVFCP